MSYYYRVIFERDFETVEGKIERSIFFFLYPHQTHWIYRIADLSKDRVTVEYCRANCRHDEEYLTAWRNSNRYDGPPPPDSDDNDSTKNDSEEETTPNNDND